jgi:ankyrin repeat protein
MLGPHCSRRILSDGVTPLQHAERRGQVAVARLLRRAGAS